MGNWTREFSSLQAKTNNIFSNKGSFRASDKNAHLLCCRAKRQTCRTKTFLYWANKNCYFPPVWAASMKSKLTHWLVCIQFSKWLESKSPTALESFRRSHRLTSRKDTFNSGLVPYCHEEERAKLEIIFKGVSAILLPLPIGVVEVLWDLLKPIRSVYSAFHQSVVVF